MLHHDSSCSLHNTSSYRISSSSHQRTRKSSYSRHSQEHKRMGSRTSQTRAPPERLCHHSNSRRSPRLTSSCSISLLARGNKMSSSHCLRFFGSHCPCLACLQEAMWRLLLFCGQRMGDAAEERVEIRAGFSVRKPMRVRELAQQVTSIHGHRASVPSPNNPPRLG